MSHISHILYITSTYIIYSPTYLIHIYAPHTLFTLYIPHILYALYPLYIHYIIHIYLIHYTLYVLYMPPILYIHYIPPQSPIFSLYPLPLSPPCVRLSGVVSLGLVYTEWFPLSCTCLQCTKHLRNLSVMTEENSLLSPGRQ